MSGNVPSEMSTEISGNVPSEMSTDISGNVPSEMSTEMSDIGKRAVRNEYRGKLSLHLDIIHR